MSLLDPSLKRTGLVTHWTRQENRVVNHSLGFCFGTSEVTSPTARQEELLDDSPGGAWNQQQALPECACTRQCRRGGEVGGAEVEAGQSAKQDPMHDAHLLSLHACEGEKGPKHTCSHGHCEQWVLRGEEWLRGWSSRRATLTLYCICLYSITCFNNCYE